jgi:Mg/Co/Ni transporter MgtE
VVGNLLAPEIKSMIDARNFGALRELFREWPPADVAEVFLDLPEDEQVIIFRVLPAALAADVFEYIGVEEQQKLKSFSEELIESHMHECIENAATQSEGRRHLRSLLAVLKRYAAV